MTEKPRDRNVRRIHRWKPGTNPEDPDTDNPNVQYVHLGKMIEEDEAATPKPALWRPSNVTSTPSGLPCPNCGDPTYVVDAKTPKEILEPFGYAAEHPPDEKILALGCGRCARPVMTVRESALPRQR